MASSNNLDTLSQDGELPFGHPGRRFDDTPEGFEPSPLVDQGPELDYTPDEDGRVVHYGPGDRPLCGNDSVTAVYTDSPALVSGCRDCLELVAEDPGDDNEYMGHCLHCRREITAQGGVEWRRVAPRALLLRRRPLQVKRQQPPQDVLVFQIHRPAIREPHRLNHPGRVPLHHRQPGGFPRNRECSTSDAAHNPDVARPAHPRTRASALRG